MNSSFSHLGVYVDNDFLEKDLCDAIVSEMLSESIISKDTKTIIGDKFENDLKPKLEAFYQNSFTDFHPIQYILNDTVLQFKSHEDEPASKITIIVFLNQQLNPSSIEADFGGGNLYLYGLMENFPRKGFEIPSKKGLLVAFRSDLRYEITPVRFGNRCTFVSWLV